jgi:acylphosphatase
MRLERRRAASAALANLIEFSALRPERPACSTRCRPALLDESGFSRMREVSATIPKFVSDEKQSRRYFVSGIVQGVGFRFFAQREAAKLRVGGYARNLFDGRVEVLAIGMPAQLDEMKSALERGPRFSSVSGVREEAAHHDRRYEKGFVIEPDASEEDDEGSRTNG